MCTYTRVPTQNDYLQSSDWLPLGLMSDLIICMLCEELDVFNDIQCPWWEQVHFNNIKFNSTSSDDIMYYRVSMGK